MARRFHDARFDDGRFDSAPPAALRPTYLRQEHAQDRFVREIGQRRKVARIKHRQRLRQRPLTAWAPQRSSTSPQPKLFTPWRIWTIRR